MFKHLGDHVGSHEGAWRTLAHDYGTPAYLALAGMSFQISR